MAMRSQRNLPSTDPSKCALMLSSYSQPTTKTILGSERQSHGFSERAINNQEASLTPHITIFINKLRHNAEVRLVTDMSQWFPWLTFDLICEFTLGIQLGCVENSENHPWVSILERWFRATAFAANANTFVMLSPFVMMLAYINNLMGIKLHLKKVCREDSGNTCC